MPGGGDHGSVSAISREIIEMVDEVQRLNMKIMQYTNEIYTMTTAGGRRGSSSGRGHTHALPTTDMHFPRNMSMDDRARYLQQGNMPKSMSMNAMERDSFTMKPLGRPGQQHGYAYLGGAR